MSERFHPYDGYMDGYPSCDVPDCSQVATQFDSFYNLFFCDDHAHDGVPLPDEVQCPVCANMVPPSHMKQGVCLSCRSTMIYLWPDDWDNGVYIGR